MNRKFLGAVFAVWLLVVALLYAPLMILHYVDGHFPGIHPDSVRIAWKKLIFSKVRVDRPSVRGQLDRVEVDWDRNILVDGGHLTVNMSAPTEDQETHRHGLTVHNLTAMVVKDDLVVDIEGLDRVDHDTHFKKLSTTYRGVPIVATDGTVAPGLLTAKVIEATITIPFELPESNGR